MKISCDFMLGDRRLPHLNMKVKQKTIHAQLSIGYKPSSASLPKEGALLMVCTAKNRSGTKYVIRNNVDQVFARFIDEGKLTIRLKNPEHDLIVSKCDPLELKCFFNILKQALQGLELKREHRSTLVPASSKDVTRAQIKMTILTKKDYPLSRNFPISLETLVVNTCNLKRFDERILKLYNLTALDMSKNVIRQVPTELSKLPLKSLILSNNQIEKLDANIFCGSLANSLQLLQLSENALELLPRSITNLQSLVRLTLNKNRLRCLPYGLISIRTLKFVQASDNQIRTLPTDFVEAYFDELDLFGNPLQTEITNDVASLKLPSLVELSARSAKVHKLHYTADDLPRTLVAYLDQGRQCVCGSYCFQSFARISVHLDLRKISRDVVRFDYGGYSAKVEAFLCSIKCLKRYERRRRCQRN